MTVRDDGEGFDPEAVSAGFGLLGMRERLALVARDARDRVHAGRGGTTMRASIPGRSDIDASRRGRARRKSVPSGVCAPRGTTITGHWAVRVSRPLTPPTRTERSGP